MLNESQQERARAIWRHFAEGDPTVVRGGRDYTPAELSETRREIIPVAQDYLRKFQENNLSLEKFKSEINNLNRGHRLWGYRGKNGGAYLETLFRISSGAGLLYKLESVLRQSLSAPSDLREARQKIDLLSRFSDSLDRYVPPSDPPPRTAAVNYLLSYFWQLQDPEEWPVQFRFLVETFRREGFYSPGGDRARDFDRFLSLNEELQALFEDEAGETPTFWEIEYAVDWWRRTGLDVEAEEEAGSGQRLPSDFLPPVISVLPDLVSKGLDIEDLCEQQGLSVTETLQRRLARAWTVLGFEVQEWDVEFTVEPAGVARPPSGGYALMYRGLTESASVLLDRNRQPLKQHLSEKRRSVLEDPAVKDVYFLVVSDGFESDYATEIRSLKMETDIREIVLVEVKALLELVRTTLRTPRVRGGAPGLQDLFADSGLLTERLLREYLGL